MDMGDKKHLGRFTVQFNLYDPQQARASEILEQQGAAEGSVYLRSHPSLYQL